jgi:hypothetical protein
LLSIIEDIKNKENIDDEEYKIKYRLKDCIEFKECNVKKLIV